MCLDSPALPMSVCGSHIDREGNKRADQLANQAMNNRETTTWEGLPLVTPTEEAARKQ